MSARIYDRPDIDQRRQNLALLVVGSFDTARPSEPYESRLQIKNGVGACRVRQIDGDTLPPGHQLYVDQATAEVVLTWPAFQSQAAPITNPGFEGGPAAWEGGAGWAVTTLGPIVGAWSGEYASNRGESVLSNTARYAVYPGQRTLAKCKVRQGASAEGNAGASVLLEYRNADGGVVSAQEGNRVMSASKGAVYDSTVEGQAPVGATTVNIASNGIRYRENKPLFVDEFEWNHTVAVVGINYEAEYTVSLQVSDSAGRAAIWRGKVRVLFGEVDPFWDNVVSVMNFEGIGDDFHDGKGHTWNAQGGVVQVGGGITLAVDGQSVWSDGPFPGQSAMTDFTIEAFITVAAGTSSKPQRVLTAPGKLAERSQARKPSFPSYTHSWKPEKEPEQLNGSALSTTTVPSSRGLRLAHARTTSRRAMSS